MVFLSPSRQTLGEDGGSMVLRNIGILPQLYTSSEFKEVVLNAKMIMTFQTGYSKGRRLPDLPKSIL
jgi:hypothetical protein